MAAAAVSRILFDGPNMTILNVQGVWDTADETDTIIWNASNFTGPSGGVCGKGSSRIDEITWAVSGDFESVVLEWDAITDSVIDRFQGQGYVDFRPYGGKTDPEASGGTGDIFLTSVGGTTNSNYMFLIVIRKKDI